VADEQRPPEPAPDKPAPVTPVSNEAAPAMAWQPFTFGGVAKFATAPLRRLFLVQLIFAVVTSASITWFASHAYGPVITQTIAQLPETAAIEGGEITGINTPITVQTKFVSVQIDTSNEPAFSELADCQIECRKMSGRACSLLRSVLGCIEFDYPSDHKFSLARSHLEPWWGARQPLIWALTFVALVVYMIVSWALLAIVWTFVAKLVAWFADRRLSWFGGWKVCSAALMPGVLLLALAARLYHWQAIDLIALSFFYVGHLVVGLVYVIGGAFKCPKLDFVATKKEAKPKNPFA
jgi:hypothetical protein